MRFILTLESFFIQCWRRKPSFYSPITRSSCELSQIWCTQSEKENCVPPKKNVCWPNLKNWMQETVTFFTCHFVCCESSWKEQEYKQVCPEQELFLLNCASLGKYQCELLHVRSFSDGIFSMAVRVGRNNLNFGDLNVTLPDFQVAFRCHWQNKECRKSYTCEIKKKSGQNLCHLHLNLPRLHFETLSFLKRRLGHKEKVPHEDVLFLNSCAHRLSRRRTTVKSPDAPSTLLYLHQTPTTFWKGLKSRCEDEDTDVLRVHTLPRN